MLVYELRYSSVALCCSTAACPACVMLDDMQGAVIWAPFGATCWPAKLVQQPGRSATTSPHQTRQSPAALQGLQTALQGPKTAFVELFGTGLRVEVSPDGLIPWDQDCAGKCALLHSDMGKEVCIVAVSEALIAACTAKHSCSAMLCEHDMADT